MTKHRTTQHPLKLPKAYAYYLSGRNIDDILKKGLSDAELNKIKLFDACISEGTHYLIACHKLKIGESTGKRLLKIYYEHKEGKPLSYHIQQSRIKTAFKLLLVGYSHEELLAKKISEEDIRIASDMISYAKISDTMLKSVIASKVGLTKTTVSELLKIFRNRQAELKLHEDKSIPVLALGMVI
jgi:hypothetical protein